ncbi:hypothetical protein [Thiobacillus denitrificans]|uniref:hypothetical protein n=1 Tax=Thiobacillus denitrificans TaxID=36861 RepID=UPI000365D084|nr:hypothetical protein [Thiobacillus denitrificans]
MKPPLKKRVPKPRNPYVALAIQRRAGAHEKPASAQRQAEKQALKKSLDTQ